MPRQCEMVQVGRLSELQTGDIIRHRGGGDPYVVTASYGGRVTAVRTQDVTNPIEWLVLREVPEKPNGATHGDRSV